MNSSNNLICNLICPGCGARVQTEHPGEKGFVRAEILARGTDFLCERCFSLVHYHKDCPLPFDAEHYQNNMSLINEAGSVVVAVCDMFDLEGTFLPNLNRMFPNNPLILVANKVDLYAKDINLGRLNKYLNDYRGKTGVHVRLSTVISTKNPQDALYLLTKIEEFRLEAKDKKHVYFVGMTNVGKSSLIKSLAQASHNSIPAITVSDLVSTTQDIIEVPLKQGYSLCDTPGLLNKKQITYYLTKETLEHVVPKKCVKPCVIQWHNGNTLCIGGFALVTIKTSGPTSVVGYFAKDVILHRTKTDRKDEYYHQHLDDELLYPTPEEREKIGLERKTWVYQTHETHKVDICLSGLGYLTIKGNAQVSVDTFSALGVALRDALI